MSLLSDTIDLPQSETSRHGNLQKHQNPNPMQRWRIDRFHQRILTLLSYAKPKSVLDAGCGEGFTLAQLQDALTDTTLVGVDFSRMALSWAKKQETTRAGLGISDIHRLPFADDQFDLVMSLEVLEHLPRSEDGLQELLRVSKDYVLVSVPHEPWFRGANFLRGKHLTAFGNDPEHLHNYTGRAFRQMVAGFAHVRWAGYSFPWQIALLQK
jgi:SAM-dependent methyltransferase